MYPLKFKPILKSTLWGGDALFGWDCKDENVSLP